MAKVGNPVTFTAANNTVPKLRLCDWNINNRHCQCLTFTGDGHPPSNNSGSERKPYIARLGLFRSDIFEFR